MYFEKLSAGGGVRGWIQNSPESARLHSVFGQEIEEKVDNTVPWRASTNLIANDFYK